MRREPVLVLLVLLAMCTGIQCRRVSSVTTAYLSELSGSFKPDSVKSISVGGKISKEFKGGDYVSPRFSPDEKYLAFGEIIQKDGIYVSQVKLLNLGTDQETTILDAEQTKRYAVYAAHVIDMQWLSPQRLKISIWDGDTDMTHLVVDPHSGKISSETKESLTTLWAEKEVQKVLKRNFPVLEGDEISDMMIVPHHFIRLGPQEMAVQLLKENTERDIWLVNLGNGKKTKLIDFGTEGEAELCGAAKSGDSTLFLVNKGGNTMLVGLKGSHLKLHDVIEGSPCNIKIKPQGLSGTVVMVAPLDYAGKRFLYLLSGGGQAFRLSPCESPFDVDFSKDEKLMAASCWTGGRRTLKVMEMKGLLTAGRRSETQ